VEWPARGAVTQLDVSAMLASCVYCLEEEAEDLERRGRMQEDR
jgi:hypothetical protein